MYKWEDVKQQLRGNLLPQRVIIDWNPLQEVIVEAVNVNAFKNKLDKHWHDY